MVHKDWQGLSINQTRLRRVVACKHHQLFRSFANYLQQHMQQALQDPSVALQQNLHNYDSCLMRSLLH